MKPLIEYREDALVITLKCSDPAAMHSQLMQSIAKNMNTIANSSEHPKNLSDEISPLLFLLQSILPTERVLNRLYH